MNFQLQNSHTSPLFRKTSVLKFKDMINLENILFISQSINNLLPSLFNNGFIFSSDTHNYNTSWSPNDKSQKYSYRTNIYGKKSISLRLLTPNKIKLLLSNEYLKNYWVGTYDSFIFFLVWSLHIFRTCYLVFDLYLFTTLLSNSWFKNK